jgi:hypothetical protein
MADEPKFCTVEDVKRFTPINANFNVFDQKINDLIPIVTRLVRAYCGREFIQKSYTEYHDAIRGQTPFKLWLKEKPISGTPVIRIDYAYDWDNNQSNIDTATYYVQDAEKGLVVFRGELTYNFYPASPVANGKGVVRVVYTGGYAEDPDNVGVYQVPAHVRDATAMQVAFMLQRAQGQELGQQAKETKGVIPQKILPGSVQGLIAEARMLLNVERRSRLG